MTTPHQDVFREEALELLGELENALLALESSPGDSELLGRVFRAMHTIKGAGAMFGFEDISTFTHEVETVLDHARKGAVPVGRELIDLCLAARDQILIMLQADAKTAGQTAEEEARTIRIVSGLRKLVPVPAPDRPPARAASRGEPSMKPGVSATCRIQFSPHHGIFATGTNPLLLLDELRGLGKCTIIAQVDRIPPLETINPEFCYTYWDIILTTDRGLNAIKDVFIFVEDCVDLQLDVIATGDNLEEVSNRRVGEILVERGDLSASELQAVLSRKKLLGELLVDTGMLPEQKVQSALMEQEHLRQLREKISKSETVSTVRVPAQRLDILVDLVGELVTLQARLSQTAANLEESRLLSIAEEVERLTVELRDNTMSLRMVPIGSLFGKFQRLIRDLSGELGKQVEIHLDGEETELDKTVIDRLNDPLIHLVRNCIDHGIETPADRLAAGKPPAGSLRLEAAHSGAHVLIRIADDGAGLNTDAIRAKAVESGLIAPHLELDPQQLQELIFQPGFSTARRVSNVSGRGVGMDVVKRNIESLGGSVELTSQRGRGTAVTLKIPLTLAIIEGFLVRIGDGYFVLPLSSVEECVELSRGEFDRSRRQSLIHVRGEVIPYLYLRDFFDIRSEPPAIQQVVITSCEGARVGFTVDHVIGGHQTVIKTLGKLYKNVEGISGATILGDGTVALILDINRLLRILDRQTQKI